YLAYLPADRLGFSGVLATVVAGLLLSRTSTTVFTPEIRLLAESAWQVFVLVANSAAFLLVGLQLPDIVRGLGDRSVLELAALAVVFSGAVILARAAWFAGTTFLPWSPVADRSREFRQRRLPFIAIGAWSG